MNRYDIVAAFCIVMLWPSFSSAQFTLAPIEQTITLRSNEVKIDLTIGQVQGATDNFDVKFDLPSPPCPPSPAFCAQILYEKDIAFTYYKDLRKLKSQDTFFVMINYNTAVRDISIEWPTITDFSGKLVLLLQGVEYDLTKRTQLSIKLPVSENIALVRLDRLTAGIGEGQAENMTNRFRLEQGWPNPFNQNVRIQYELAMETKVELIIYSVLGQKIATLVDAKQQAGSFTITWNGFDEYRNIMPSGIYFLRFAAGEYIQIRKMTIIR